MQPIRQVINDFPDFVPMPPELRHKRVEIILWPLPDEQENQIGDSQESLWPPGVFESLAGAWQGDFPEREPQGEYEERLELE
jgi:hypothetical protein